ncbi:putative methyltransferase DDB_G0268948 [Nilaparvata lugens]|uniref:putative methyltransferase DDB_G0268948 n=1 Tax=Nilaparvata lugens TaxID=108931 RepID=UPI00193DD701|nr:putative methyltransferase DDB_G0268948 [Nilaparvata lugens]XP_022200261.2 putative methyltransferase DDB_G0268948 [Nilaparvata lugens]
MNNDEYLTTLEQAESYNKFRPSPPPKLIARIIEFLKEKVPTETAIDVGCGSGQSTNHFAPYFKRVIGIDNCQMQIMLASNTNSHHNIQYKLGEYNRLEEPNESVQLVCACQSAHFFDMKTFYKEVERVLVPDGVLAICGYSLPIPFSHGIMLGNIVQEAFDTMSSFICNQQSHVYIHRYTNDDFQNFPFSRKELIREYFEKVEETATVQNLIGFVKSWSAYKNFQKSKGVEAAEDVIRIFQNKILLALNKADEDPADVEISIKFPFILLMGRKSYK